MEILKNKITDDDLQQIIKDNTRFLQIISKYAINFSVFASITENINEFVDMGYMQAIDIITAIEVIKIILKENELSFNEDRIIGSGQSQGAYLLHLSNKLAPHLFSLIIDNSAWVQPVYLQYNRMLNIQCGNALLNMEFDYIAKRIIKDKDALSLHEMYKGFTNGTYIYSCIGTTDSLVKVDDKVRALSKLNHVNFEVIDKQKVDGVKFKSTNHGLDADFINLVEYVMSIVPPHKNQNEKFDKYVVESSMTKINVDYSHGLPVFQFI